MCINTKALLYSFSKQLHNTSLILFTMLFLLIYYLVVHPTYRNEQMVLTWLEGETSIFKMSSNHQRYDSRLTQHGTWPCLTCLSDEIWVRTLTHPSLPSTHPTTHEYTSSQTKMWSLIINYQLIINYHQWSLTKEGIWHSDSDFIKFWQRMHAQIEIFSLIWFILTLL